MVRADRREQLLAVAAEIIAADGLAALTMANLSERANIAKPVVYTHFANRNQVAIALLENHANALRVYFEKRLPNIATLSDYIVAVVETSFEFESASTFPIRKITNGFSADDEVNRAFLRESAQMRDRWRHLLEMLHVPPDQAMIAATIMHDMVRTAIYHFANKAQLTVVSRKVAKDTLVQLLMGCLRSVAPGGDLQNDAIDFANPPGNELTKVR